MNLTKHNAGKFKSIKLNYFFSTAYQMFNMIVPLITAPYISRVLTVDGVGVYSYTNSICTYFILCATLGTASYGAREIARVRFEKNQRSILFWEIEILSLFTTLTSLLIWFVLIIFSNKYKVFYLVMSLQILANAFDIAWFFEGMEEFLYTVSRSFVIRILGIIALFVFVREQNDLFVYILILSVQALCSSLAMWIYIPKFVNRVSIKSLRIKRHFKETLIYFIPTIAASIYTVLDKTLIGLISGSSSENGNYEQATKIINMAKSVTFASLNTIMRSRISYLFKEELFDEIKDRIRKSLDFILFLGLGITFGIEAIADDFVPVFFGKGYDETVVLLRILAPIVVVIGVGNCLGSHYYTPAGYRLKSARYIIYGSVINLLLNLCLIPRYNSAGAAIASIIAELSITLLYIINCDGYFDAKCFVKNALKKILAALVMVVTIAIIKTIIVDAIALRLVITICTGVIVYMGCLILLDDSFVKGYVFRGIGDRLKHGNRK